MAPVKVRPAPDAPAGWIPLVHALAGALVAVVGLVSPGLPQWALPLFVVAGVLVFGFGVLVYAWHRNHWSEASFSGWLRWLESDVVPELQGDVANLRGALPPDLAKRLGRLEMALESANAAHSSTAPPVDIAPGGLLEGPQSAKTAPEAQPPPGTPRAAPAPAPGADAALPSIAVQP